MTQETGDRPPWGVGQAPAQAPSATQVAGEEAAGVAETARQDGNHVAHVASEQVKQVASETGKQARGLWREGRGQLRDQAQAGQQWAARGIDEFADELVEMAGKSKRSGPGSQLARIGAEQAHSLATWLGDREPGDLLEEVQRFARRRPGTFLLAAAVAGVVAGRLTRGLASGGEDSTSARGESRPAPEAAPADAPRAAPPRSAVPPVDDPRPTVPMEPTPSEADLTGAAPQRAPSDAPYGGWGPPPRDGFEPYPGDRPEDPPPLSVGDWDRPDAGSPDRGRAGT